MAVMEIECMVCGEALKTQDVAKAIAFDREHTAAHAPTDDAQGGRA